MESMKPTAQHLQQRRRRRPMLLQRQSRLKVNELMRLFFSSFFFISKSVESCEGNRSVSTPFFFFTTSCPTEDEMLNI